MDTLSRAAAGIQRWSSRLSGCVFLSLAGAYLTLTDAPGRWVSGEVGDILTRLPFAPWWLDAAVLVAVAGWLWRRLLPRRGRLPRSRRRQIEIETGLSLSVLVYPVVAAVPGGFGGSAHSLVYAVMVVAAAFLSRSAIFATWVGSAAFELAYGHLLRHQSVFDALVHVALLAVFGGLNAVLFRGEIARVRRLSKERVERELARMRDAARSYRLAEGGKTELPSVALDVEPDEAGAQQLVHSSVQHLQLSLRFMLFLLRRSLGLKTAALLWIQEYDELILKEASSSERTLVSGPFRCTEGVFAAIAASERPTVVRDTLSNDAFPLYEGDQSAPAICGVPLMLGDTLVGVLLADAESRDAFSGGAVDMLASAAEFALRAVENEQLFLKLEQARTQQSKLYFSVGKLADARTEVDVIRAGVDTARQFARFDLAAVTLFHKSARTHEICAVSGPGSDDLVGQRFEHNAGLVSMVVDNGHALPCRGQYVAGRHQVFSPELEMPDMPSLIILPLIVHDAPLGTLVLGSETPDAFSDQVRPTLEVLARHIAVSLSNARLLKRLEELATTDGMTGLLNKRSLTAIARQKIRSAIRFDKPLSVVIGDIDLFKRVNDTFGHDVGDVVIKGFGAVLKRSMRETDSVGRFGGEEFVLVCEETDVAGAELLAERIRQELEATTFHAGGEELSVTCSLGVATYPAAGADWEALFKAADEALYVSKRNGRNQVTLWSPKLRDVAA